MKVTQCQVYPIAAPAGNLRALAKATLDDELQLTGLKIYQGANGLFVSYPNDASYKGEDYRQVYYPITRELREDIETTILLKYQQELGTRKKVMVTTNFIAVLNNHRKESVNAANALMGCKITTLEPHQVCTAGVKLQVLDVLYKEKGFTEEQISDYDLVIKTIENHMAYFEAGEFDEARTITAAIAVEVESI